MSAATLVSLYFATDFPPLSDYPNHLARYYLLAHYGASALRADYTLAWSNMPGIGIDAILSWVMTEFSADLVGRLYVILVVLSLFASLVVYAKVVFGRLTWWSSGGVLVALNGTFLFGFLTFNLACAEALFFAALWRHVRERAFLASLLFLMSASTLLWFTHASGLAFFLVLCLSAELDALVKSWRAHLLDRAILYRTFGLIIARYGPTGLLLFVLYRTSALHDVAGSSYIGLLEKPRDAFVAISSVYFYDDRLFLALDILIILLLITTLVVAWFRRGLLFDSPSLIAIGVCALLFAVTPVAAKGGYWLDTRFVVMVLLLTFAGLDIAPVPRSSFALASAVVVLTWVRVLAIGEVWRQSEETIRQARSVLSCVPAGSKIEGFALGEPTKQQETGHFRGSPTLYYHVPGYSIIDRDAFWPNLFAYAGQQPIRLAPQFQSLTRHTASPTWSAFVTEANGTAHLTPYARMFNFVLVVNPFGTPIKAVEGLHAVAAHRYASLYSVGDRATAPGCIRS